MEEEQSELSVIGELPSVQNEELDAQHEACARALNALLKEPSTDTLAHAGEVIREHFE